MGIYIFRRDRIKNILNSNVYIGTSTVITDLVDAGDPVLNYTEDCLWLDIGNPNDYEMVQTIVESHPDLLGMDMRQTYVY